LPVQTHLQTHRRPAFSPAASGNSPRSVP
jgi:hypothetical protein